RAARRGGRGQHVRVAFECRVPGRDEHGPVEGHVRGGQRDRVLRGGRPELVRCEPLRGSARRQQRPDQHARRAQGLRSLVGDADLREDAGRRLAPELPLKTGMGRDAEISSYRTGMRPPAAVLLVLAGAAAGCDAGKTKLIGADYPTCQTTPEVPPPSLGVSSFYGKYLDSRGIPVLSSAAVADPALQTACTIVGHMLSARDDVRQAMMGLDMTVVVMGRNEVTTEIPEYANLYTTNPPDDWDSYRGIGATKVIPVTSAGEENVLCERNDPYA